MRLLIFGLSFFALMGASKPVFYKQIVNADIGFALSGRSDLIEALSDFFSVLSKKIAGPTSSVQMRVGSDAAEQGLLWGEFDATKLYAHWFKETGFLKHRNVVYRLGLDRLQKIRLHIGPKENPEPEIDVIGIGKSQLPALLSHLSKVHVWQPTLKAGEAFANVAINPERMWLLFERVATGLYPMEMALLRANFASIEKQLNKNLLRDAFGEKAHLLWIWHELKASQPHWAMKMGMNDGEIAEAILSPFLAMLPVLIPGVTVSEKNDGKIKFLTIEMAHRGTSKTYILFARESVYWGNSLMKIHDMRRAKPRQNKERNGVYAASGAFRPAANMKQMWPRSRQQAWFMSVDGDHLQVHLR